MKENQVQFETISELAEQTLKKTEEGIDASMGKIDKEKYNGIIEKMITENVEKVIRIVSSSMDEMQMVTEEERTAALYPIISSTLIDLPPDLGEMFLREICSKSEWKELVSDDTRKVTDLVMSLVITSLGKKHVRMEEERILNDRDESDISPISFGFGNDTFSSPVFFGTVLPEYTELFLSGDAGAYAGDAMLGGKIFIKGNCGDLPGYSMKGGEITITGSAGAWTGYMMEKGKITVGEDAGDHCGCAMKDGEITVQKNVGKDVGEGMKGGRVEVHGNAGDYIGYHMKSGTVEIFGDAGEWAGSSMEGGTLILHGKVSTFSCGVFVDQNHGTVIWKGITLWSNGWTEEGISLCNAKKIPF